MVTLAPGTKYAKMKGVKTNVLAGDSALHGAIYF
jgi:hypothetical protein